MLCVHGMCTFLICANVNASLSQCDSCASFYAVCMSKLLFMLIQVDFSAAHQETSENISFEVNECVRVSRKGVCLSDVNFFTLISERQEKRMVKFLYS